MNLLNPGVEKIVFNVDVFTYEISGNDISPDSTLTKRQQTRTASRGGYLPFLVEYTLEIKTSDRNVFDAFVSGLYTLVIHKTNGNIEWNEPERMIKEEDVLFDPESQEYPLILKMKHISTNPDIGQVP